MAFADLALRLATVRALKARTVAGERVSDSRIAPIDQRAAEERQPTLAVYTDDLTADVSGRDLLAGDRSLQLTIEIVCASAADFDGDIAVTVPETDEGLELTIDLAERQILRTFMADASPWASIWRDLAARVRKLERQRGAGLKEGLRFAARQIVLTVEPLAEPPFGSAPVGVWRRFLDQVEAEPDLAALAPALEAAIVGEPLPDWRQIQAVLGLTDDAAQAIGVSPAVDASPIEEAPEFVEITVAGDDGDRVIEQEP